MSNLVLLCLCVASFCWVVTDLYDEQRRKEKRAGELLPLCLKDHKAYECEIWLEVYRD